MAAKDQNQKKQSGGKEMTGTVMSVKMQQTVIVGVMQIRQHPLYKKSMRSMHRFAAHNDLKDIAVGDHVRIRETIPMSKTKHFKVVEKVKI